MKSYFVVEVKGGLTGKAISDVLIALRERGIDAPWEQVNVTNIREDQTFTQWIEWFHRSYEQQKVNGDTMWEEVEKLTKGYNTLAEMHNDLATMNMTLMQSAAQFEIIREYLIKAGCHASAATDEPVHVPTLVSQWVQQVSDLIHDQFVQGCLKINGYYDHQHISCYEKAQAWLLQIGRIRADECKYAD